MESTAINDLIGQVRGRALSREGEEDDDWMFGEQGDATEIDPVIAVDPAPLRPRTPPLVPLPQPFVRVRAPAVERMNATQFVRKSIDWAKTAKLMILPIGLFAIVVVLLGVYFAKQSSDPPKAAAKVVMASEPAPAKAAAPVAPMVTPIEAPAPAPAAAPPPPRVVEPPPPAAAVVEPPPAQPAPPPAVVTPPAAADSGSPASRFLNAPPVEPTITSAAAETAPAPKAPEPSVAPTPPPPAKAKAKAKSKRERAAKRAIKRVAKAPVKKRAAKQLTINDDEAEETPPPVAKKDGKGVLAVSSTPSLEVWVDGRNSKAMTPLRVILLSGKHKVTLFDKEHGKAHTFDVEIRADETTKVSKSYE